MSDDFFAPPAFKPGDALPALKKQLRELRLAEREGVFELKGNAIAALTATESTIEARIVKRPQRTPEWTSSSLKNSADVRRFVDTLKQQLARWGDDE